MSHKYLTINERNKIEVLLKENYSVNKISKIIGVHRSTIYREIKRCHSVYDASIAQKDFLSNSKKKGRNLKACKNLISLIQNRLKKTWSPEQIIGRELKGKLAFKTIYNWIYSGIIKIELTHLRRKGKTRKPRETRGKFNIGSSIDKRPKHVKTREEFGHWELDTVVSSRGKSKGCLATFAERKTRFYIAIKISDRSKTSMLQAIKKLMSYYPKEALKSFTSDRGKEFACWKEVENMGIPFYFTDAYSAWQRGTNENSNGLLREFYPKKTDLAKISEKELKKGLNLINSRPRKCLNYVTSGEKFLYELEKLKMSQ